jgi:hypothetical protein
METVLPATVALSTTKAEYMASADATQQAIWLKLLLSDLGIDHSCPVLFKRQLRRHCTQ